MISRTVPIALAMLLSGATDLFVCTMERGHSAITNQNNNTPKKKRRGRRGGNTKPAQHFNLEQLEQCDLKKLFKYDTQSKESLEKYLEKLNNFANVLVLHERIIKSFRVFGEIIPLMKENEQFRRIPDSNSFVRGVCSTSSLDYSEQTKAYLGNNPAIYEGKGQHGHLYSMGVKGPQAHAAALQLAKFWNKDDKESIKKGLQLADRLCILDDRETSTLGRMAKHWFYSSLFRITWKNLPAAAIGFTACINPTDCLFSKICSFTNVDKVSSNVLRQLPDFNLLFEYVRDLNIFYRDGGDDFEDSVVISDDFRDLGKKIRKLNNRLSPLEANYAKLYKMIIGEINTSIDNIVDNTIKNCAKFKRTLHRKFGIQKVRILGENITLPPSIWNNNTILSAENKKSYVDNDWLSDSYALRIRKNSQQKKYPSKNKKPYSKKSEQLPDISKPSHNTPQTPTTFTRNIKNRTSRYAQRVIRWFDENSQDPTVRYADTRCYLYHSFPLIADKYIFSIGIQTPWHSCTVPGQTDTNYSLGGEIVYPNGERKTVVFTCCKDKNGICYHRGFTLKEKNEFFDEYFRDCKWQVDFPPLVVTEEQSSSTQEILYHYNSSDKYHIQHEDELHVRIDDPKNNVTIVLYKPYHDLFESAEN